MNDEMKKKYGLLVDPVKVIIPLGDDFEVLSMSDPIQIGQTKPWSSWGIIAIGTHLTHFPTDVVVNGNLRAECLKMLVDPPETFKVKEGDVLFKDIVRDSEMSPHLLLIEELPKYAVSVTCDVDVSPDVIMVVGQSFLIKAHLDMQMNIAMRMRSQQQRHGQIITPSDLHGGSSGPIRL